MLRTVHYVIGNSNDMNMKSSFELPSIIAYAKTEDALKQEEEPAMWGSLLPGDCLYVPPGAITVFKVHGSAAIFLRSQSAVTPGHTFMRVPGLQLSVSRACVLAWCWTVFEFVPKFVPFVRPLR